MSFNSFVNLSKMTNMFMVVFLLFSLLFISGQSTPPASALYKFTAVDLCNTTMHGTVRFRKEIGINFMIKIMQEASDFIFKVFEEQDIGFRKHPVGTKVHMEVHDEFKDAVGYYFLNSTNQVQTILISAAYMENIPADTLKDRVKELVFHEMTHVWQWYGNESSPSPPSMLFEGIAEYVPLVAGLKNYEGEKPGGGDKWNEGYEVTAFFLAYCNSLKPGFVAALNRRMKLNYSDTYFKDLLGKPVEELWRDYKNKYKNQEGGRSRIRDIIIKDR